MLIILIRLSRFIIHLVELTDFSRSRAQHRLLLLRQQLGREVRGPLQLHQEHPGHAAHGEVPGLLRQARPEHRHQLQERQVSLGPGLGTTRH